MTETDGYVVRLRFPSQFQVGEGIIWPTPAAVGKRLGGGRNMSMIRLDRLPAAVDTHYRRFEVWDDPYVYGHVEIPGDEHWDPGSLSTIRRCSRWSATFSHRRRSMERC